MLLPIYVLPVNNYKPEIALRYKLFLIIVVKVRSQAWLRATVIGATELAR